MQAPGSYRFTLVKMFRGWFPKADRCEYADSYGCNRDKPMLFLKRFQALELSQNQFVNSIRNGMHAGVRLESLAIRTEPAEP